MGSLSASGIPVVSKQSLSFRKHDVRIKYTDNRNDAVSGIISYRPSENRTIGSGSVIDDLGNVTYHEELVVGTYRMARSSDERNASADTTRVRVVTLQPSGTLATVEDSLLQPIPQRGAKHTGNRIVRSNSADDSLIDRASDAGSFD